jgi:gamma-glutamylcyclotransferase (GGCT)/AIG2-like uncharacterized protein YtfP
VLYFAYGSNMDLRQMARRCRGARPVGPALLRDHKLTFTWDSHFWEGGVGHVEPSEGGLVWGVLWDCTPEHIAALDAYERVDDGVYVRANVIVEHDGTTTEALVYLANDTGYKAPSKRYLRTLVRGARANRLPVDYVAELESLFR